MLAVRASGGVPAVSVERISLAHGGGGGRASQHLLETVFRPAFANHMLDLTHDGAVVDAAGARLAFTTDSYVVRPLFFPGGTVGDLAVNGTVNDLAMCGARPLWLSAAFVLEDGLPMSDLRAIVTAMRDAARGAGVSIVTGDTKVVERGKGDGVFITTAGVGIIEHTAAAPERVRPGDAVIVSGDLGAHGVAIMSVRDGLGFDRAVKSDTAPLWPAVKALYDAGVDVRCMRDLTRGLASALHEIAATARVSIAIDEAALETATVVRAACELIGLDPLYVASEGRFVTFVAPADVPRALDALRGVDVSREAAFVGLVENAHRGLVTLRRRLGGSRVVDVLTREQVPRGLLSQIFLRRRRIRIGRERSSGDPASVSLPLRALLAGLVVYLTVFVSANADTPPMPQSAPATQPAQAPKPAPPPAPAPQTATSVSAPQNGYVGSDTCLLCHDGMETTLKGTAHAQKLNPRSPEATQGCESCHGPGQQHVDDDAKVHIRKFAKVSPEETNGTCLTCHNRGAHAGWEGSTHERRNLSCTTCHSVHSPKSPAHQLVKATQTQLCATCHRTASGQDRARRGAYARARRKMFVHVLSQPALAPVTNVKALKTEAPSGELCTTCHYRDAWTDAVGARASQGRAARRATTRMDRRTIECWSCRMPMLCQRCPRRDAPSSSIYDKDEITVNKSNRMFGRSCVNCHSNVHGSNHPSGQFFMR
jgi:hydrogenase expression/formation protein HypE